MNIDKYRYAKLCKQAHPNLSFRHIKDNFSFPSNKPENGIIRSDSFLGEDNKQVFPRFISENSKDNIILDMGSWYGASGRYWCDILKNKNSTGNVLCIDHFRMSVEHLLDDKYVQQSKTMLDDFYVTNWEYKDSMLVLPMTAHTALELLYVCNVKPTIIYCDNSHDFWSVYKDIEMSLELFGKSIMNKETLLCGDDAFSEEVFRAVETICEEKQLQFKNTTNVWWIDIQ